MCRCRTGSSGTSWAVGAKVFEVAFCQLLVPQLECINESLILICCGEKCVGPGDEAPSLPIGLCILNVYVYCLFVLQGHDYRM
jgi:hypothetical protein